MTDTAPRANRHASPPHLTLTVADERFGPIGYVVIDRPLRGTTSGGTRFAPDVSPAELAQLARAMTYKWAFLNVPMGGAKAGVFADPDRLGVSRADLMEAFGRAIAPLVQRQVYLPGIDLGTTLDDLRAIMRGAGRPLPEKQIDGSYVTALTVFETLRQSVQFTGGSLAGQRVALEGFGKVASQIAQFLAEAGARIVALSTLEGALANEAGLDVRRLLALKAVHGDSLVRYYPGGQPLAPEQLFTWPVDVVIPGARPGVIHAGNADQVQARWLVPISNVPVTADAEQRLLARGVLVLPDFVANCGGILASAMLSDGFDLDDARRLVTTTFAQVVHELLAGAQASQVSVLAAARALAWRNHDSLGQTPAQPGDLMSRVARVIRGQALDGVWRRLAWRAHHQQPDAPAAVRRAAADRFAELTLGQTLQRIQEEPSAA